MPRRINDLADGRALWVCGADHGRRSYAWTYDVSMALLRLIINGSPREVDLGDEPTVAALVREMAPPGVPCAVELNRSVVPLGHHASVTLCEGDAIEVVTFVGGG